VIDGLEKLNLSGRPKLPLVRQSEAAECGLACLAMVAAYYGNKSSLHSLRLAYAVSQKGATLKSLIGVADRLHMTSRALRINLKSLRRLKTPCILHWNMNHFVVLKTAGRDHCLIHDPARGIRRLPYADVSTRFTGIALELSPSAKFTRRRRQPLLSLSDLLGRVSGLSRVLAQTLLLSLFVQLFVIAAPFYMQLVIDEVLPRFDTDLLQVLAAGFGLAMLFNEAAAALRAYVILYLSSTLGFQMVSNLFRHLLRLPLDWFGKRHVGDIVSRFSSTQAIRDLFAEGLVAAVVDGLMALGTLLMIFIYSPLLGAIVAGTALFYLALRLALYRPLRQRHEDRIVAAAREQSTFIESVRGIQSIKVFGHEAQRQSLWHTDYADVVNSGVRIGRLKIGFNAANGLLFGMENILLVYVAALLVVDTSLTIGMLFAIMAYKNQFLDKARSLVERAIEFRLLDLHLERIADIALAAPERGLDGPAAALPDRRNNRTAAGRIELRNISYRYASDDDWVLNDISLSVSAGEMISITGQSGTGKTTLLKLILALFEPERGKLLYDGVALDKLGYGSLRGKVGTVMQGDVLLAGSIADNVSFFDPEADFEKIRHCAELAAIHADIAAMPMGYNSLVGDLGTACSAGQQQRLLLARALYREPEVLLLDEGTANLDTATEGAIIRTLQQLKITRICVAHREAMILAADRIVLLHAGCLHEISRSALLEAGQPQRGELPAGSNRPAILATRS
jgi:ATP-binding cassette subfamily B protein RaxB